MPRPRILLDITTLLRATGHADGITRTLWHLANYALSNLPHVDFVALGPAPWLVERDWVARHLLGSHRIDISHFPDANAKPRVRERLPGSMKSALLWIQRPRRQVLLTTERAILSGSWLAPLAERLRPRLINARYRMALGRGDDTLAHLVPHQLALRPCRPLGPRDALILAGSDWRGMCKALPDSSERPKVAALCYDTIPLLFPEFFDPAFVANFRRCVMEVYATADIVIFSADQIRQDTERLCGRALARTATLRLGADAAPSHRTSAASLPAGLTAGKFGLFVSTLEPRKGHRTLFEAWKRLLDERVPPSHDFKLVFVGRKGWMVDDLIAEMRAHPEFGKSFFWLENIDDATLARLYEACAFTLYPSLYEGFGLPIIESFRHGKAVIASNAGALRETVDGLSPTLDPHAQGEWLTMLRAWITSPETYQRYERTILAQFEPQSWAATAKEFFDIVLAGPAPLPHTASARSQLQI